VQSEPAGDRRRLAPELLDQALEPTDGLGEFAVVEHSEDGQRGHAR
jgi:hypothetical protein